MLTSLLSRNLRHQRFWRHYGHRVRYQMTKVEARLLMAKVNVLDVKEKLKQKKSLVDRAI